MQRHNPKSRAAQRAQHGCKWFPSLCLSSPAPCDLHRSLVGQNTGRLQSAEDIKAPPLSKMLLLEIIALYGNSSRWTVTMVTLHMLHLVFLQGMFASMLLSDSKCAFTTLIQVELKLQHNQKEWMWFSSLTCTCCCCCWMLYNVQVAVNHPGLGCQSFRCAACFFYVS